MHWLEAVSNLNYYLNVHQKSLTAGEPIAMPSQVAKIVELMKLLPHVEQADWKALAKVRGERLSAAVAAGGEWGQLADAASCEGAHSS